MPTGLTDLAVAMVRLDTEVADNINDTVPDSVADKSDANQIDKLEGHLRPTKPSESS